MVVSSVRIFSVNNLPFSVEGFSMAISESASRWVNALGNQLLTPRINLNLLMVESINAWALGSASSPYCRRPQAASCCNSAACANAVNPARRPVRLQFDRQQAAGQIKLVLQQHLFQGVPALRLRNSLLPSDSEGIKLALS